MMKFPIIDLFISIQGEGMYTGIPSLFIRTSGCNLRCVFKDSICDTPYSSFNPEKSKYEYSDVVKLLKENPKVKHIVITGGEPLMRSNELIDMLDYIKNLLRDKTITIETNGTFSPLDDSNKDWKINLYSISLKLQTSIPEVPGIVKGIDIEFTQERIDSLNKIRYNREIIKELSNKYCQWKFVYSNKESLDEIEKIVKENNLENIYLMPEGITEEQLNNKRKECVDICIKKGWYYTDRLHIIIWGDKRGF